MIAVIGSGPAGISAATYIKRANLPVTIFTNHKSSLCKATLIENYYGTGAIKGNKLYEKGIEDANKLNIDIIEDTIVDIDYQNKFTLVGIKKEYKCDAIILATGSSISKLDIPGIKDYEGKGISYCTTCDGYFFRNKKIALIGNGSYADHEYEYLKNISDNIIRFSNNQEYQNKDYINDKIIEIKGNGVGLSISLSNNKEIDVDGIFVANEYADSSTLARKIGILTENNNIIVDENMKTNVPGIFACGDNTKGLKQITKAVYEGMTAAMSAIKYYKNINK